MGCKPTEDIVDDLDPLDDILYEDYLQSGVDGDDEPVELVELTLLEDAVVEDLDVVEDDDGQIVVGHVVFKDLEPVNNKVEDLQDEQDLHKNKLICSEEVQEILVDPLVVGHHEQDVDDDQPV